MFSHSTEYLVNMLSIEGKTFTAGVRSTTSVSSTRNVSGYYEVVVNSETYTILCPFRFYEEFGMPCNHAMAIIMYNKLDPNNPNWWSKLYHIESYAEMYGSTLLLPTTDGKISLLMYCLKILSGLQDDPRKKTILPILEHLEFVNSVVVLVILHQRA